MREVEAEQGGSDFWERAGRITRRRRRDAKDGGARESGTVISG